MSILFGLTGRSGSGKTRACEEIIKAAEEAALSIFGFYCPAVFTDGAKSGIAVELLPHGPRRLLGKLEAEDSWLEVGQWYMDPSVFTWVEAYICDFKTAELLMIDEIGPAEINEGRGWPKALDLLRSDAYQLGVVTYRPALAETMQALFPRIVAIDLEAESPAAVFQSITALSNGR